MPRILVFGASITLGAWDIKGGWVGRLKTFLAEKSLAHPDLDYRVYNLGVSGNTTEDLLARFEFEAKQRIKEKEETIIIFLIGTNDSQFVISKNNLRTLPDKFRENIQQLIYLAKKLTPKILFVGLTPVDESKTTPIPWNTDKIYKNENIQKYNEIIKSVCKKNNIYFIDTFSTWIKSDYKKLLEDGLHPNLEGHREIFETVKKFLIQNKIVQLST